MIGHSYQPPIDCSHGHSRSRLYGRLRLRECRDCGLVVGVMGPPLPQLALQVLAPRPLVLPPHVSRSRRFADWLANQLDATENAFAAPRWLARWWSETF